MQVRARAQVLEVAGNRMTFKVEAHDEMDLIGEGTHQRSIGDVCRFYKRIERKLGGKRRRRNWAQDQV